MTFKNPDIQNGIELQRQRFTRNRMEALRFVNSQELRRLKVMGRELAAVAIRRIEPELLLYQRIITKSPLDKQMFGNHKIIGPPLHAWSLRPPIAEDDPSDADTPAKSGWALIQQGGLRAYDLHGRHFISVATANDIVNGNVQIPGSVADQLRDIDSGLIDLAERVNRG